MKTKQDLIIIGGGIMGLFTAYYASFFVKNITILEKSTLGDKKAASFGLTRSVRNDYLDPLYSTLAYEAQKLWVDLEKISGKKFIVSAGCLNLVKKSITPNVTNSYAYKAYKNLIRLSYDTELFTKKNLKKRYPQFMADTASLNKKAGFIQVSQVTNFLLLVLKKRNVTIIEDVTVKKISENKVIKITTNKESFLTKSMVITAALGTNDILKLLEKNTTLFPLYAEKPQECKYVFIPKKMRASFEPDKFPVFAYLDVGIYGHPIFDKRDCIKIGYYNPPDIKKSITKIASIDNFIAECLPPLKGCKSEKVTDADQCSYDMVKDDTFILGKLPQFNNIFVGCGWRGTGYKFAPLIGKILSQLALQNRTVYDITEFNPGRFNK